MIAQDDLNFTDPDISIFISYRFHWSQDLRYKILPNILSQSNKSKEPSFEEAWEECYPPGNDHISPSSAGTFEVDDFPETLSVWGGIWRVHTPEI